MRYGAIFLPEPATADALIAYSQSIGKMVSPRMTLGGQAPPHLTLLHVEGDADSVKRWWASLAETVPAALPLKLRALGFTLVRAGDYYVPEGGIYFGCEAIRTPALEAAHRQAIAAAEDNSLRILGTAAEDYNPHITLGILDRMPQRPIDLEPSLVSANIAGSLALGQLGPYGTFPKVIEHLLEASIALRRPPDG